MVTNIGGNRIIVLSYWEFKLVHFITWHILIKLKVNLCEFICSNYAKENFPTVAQKYLEGSSTALFIMGKMFKIAKYSSLDGWMNKICNSHGGILYDTLNINKLDL